MFDASRKCRGRVVTVHFCFVGGIALVALRMSLMVLLRMADGEVLALLMCFFMLRMTRTLNLVDGDENDD